MSTEPLRAGHGWLAATYARLGRMKEARAEAAEVLRMEPDYSIAATSQRVMGFKLAEDAEHFVAGLRKAGLHEWTPGRPSSWWLQNNQ